MTANRSIEPSDIKAVAKSIQKEFGAISNGFMGLDMAESLAVAAIDTLIARGNHSKEELAVEANEQPKVNKKQEVVGWQIQRIDPQEGPSTWQYATKDEYDLVKNKRDYNTRELFAEVEEKLDLKTILLSFAEMAKVFSSDAIPHTKAYAQTVEHLKRYFAEEDKLQKANKRIALDLLHYAATQLQNHATDRLHPEQHDLIRTINEFVRQNEAQ